LQACQLLLQQGFLLVQVLTQVLSFTYSHCTCATAHTKVAPGDSTGTHM
jgi:hypothetical protein